MNPFELIVSIAQQYGAFGLGAGLLVLIGVFVAKRSGLVVNGDQARIANVLLAVILAGLDPSNADSLNLITAAIASLASALAFELLKLVNNRTVKFQFGSQRAMPLSAKGAQPK